MLHSICQEIWKAQQWPQDWKRSVFIQIPKKGNTKEFSNCRKIALGNPLQCSFLGNPRDRGAWWTAVYGVAQSRTRLKWLSSSRGECNCVVVWAFFGIAFLWDLNENWLFPVLWPLLSFPNIECSTFTASSFRIWNSSAGIPSPPLALFFEMFRKVHLTLHSRGEA